MTTATFGSHNFHKGKARATAFASVIGGQEVEGVECRHELRHLDGYNHYPKARDAGGMLGPGRNTIVWRTDVWRKVGKGFVLAGHGGMFGRLPLYIVWVRLEHRETGEQVRVFNIHGPNGAWAQEDGRRAMPFTKRRRREWHRYFRALDKRVAKALRNGRHVVVLGDTNRHQWGVLPVPEAGRTDAHRPGYDRIGSDLELTKYERLSRMGSDHLRLRATYRLGRRDQRG